MRGAYVILEGQSPVLHTELGTGHSFVPSKRYLARVLRRVTSAAPLLDLWPAFPALSVSASGNSYHWGSVFPHSVSPKSAFSSDVLGRVGGWKRVHLIDASAFPTVPAFHPDNYG